MEEWLIQNNFLGLNAGISEYPNEVMEGPKVNKPMNWGSNIPFWNQEPFNPNQD